MTPPASGHLPTDCGRHLANPLPWHWHEHPAWTSTCMGKGNTVAFMRNTCGLLWQLGKHLVSQLLTAEDLVVTCERSFKQNNLCNLIQMRHHQSSVNKTQKCLTAVGIFGEGMRNKHLSSVEKKVTELLAAKDLAASCITSFK